MNKKQRAGEKVSHEAGLPIDERMDALRELYPEVFSEGAVDCAKLKQTLGDLADDSPERYSFSWAGKRDAIRLLQMPSRATLNPAPDESVDWDTTKNVFIEGDNLEVLKLMLKPYYGRVKMIYIDPPYNTGNDFVYPDNYADPLDTYLKMSGQKDADGNLLVSKAETTGRRHSAWLSMMYPRLFLARQLLRDDGVVFISIDDNEIHNLRQVMNEIFGEENFVAVIAAQTNPRGRTLDRFIAKTHEYLLVFAKDFTQQAVSEIPKDDKALKQYSKTDEIGKYRELELRNRNPVFTRKNRPNLFFPLYVNPDNESVALEKDDLHSVEVLPLNSKNEEGVWTWGKTKVANNFDLLAGRQVGTGAWRVFRKDYLPKDGATTKAKSIWLESNINHEHGKEEVGRLFGYTPFDFPKSVDLLKRCVQLGTAGDEEEIVLEFFAGSATTGQAVLELNREDGGQRRYMLVQLPEPVASDTEAYAKGLRSLADIGIKRMKLVQEKLANGEGDLKLDSAAKVDAGFRIYKLAESNYKQWTGVEDNDPDNYVEQMEAFADPLKDGWEPESVIHEVAIKEGFGLGLSYEQVDSIKSNKVFRVTDPDKEQSFLICLDNTLDKKTPVALELSKDDLFVCRDIALTDELAANLALQCRLKTV